MAMKIGGTHSVGLVDRHSWQALASSEGMDGGAVVDRAIDLTRRAPDAFASAAAQPAVIGLKSPMPSPRGQGGEAGDCVFERPDGLTAHSSRYPVSHPPGIINAHDTDGEANHELLSHK